jgi:hypothetical protein
MNRDVNTSSRFLNLIFENLNKNNTSSGIFTKEDKGKQTWIAKEKLDIGKTSLQNESNFMGAEKRERFVLFLKSIELNI